MNYEWEHVLQFVGKRSVRSHKVAVPLDGERKVNGVIDGVFMCEGYLQRGVRH